MNSVQFEQLISHRPKLAEKSEQPTLRDMVFDYYCGKFKTTDEASTFTRAYLDILHAKFVKDVAPVAFNPNENPYPEKSMAFIAWEVTRRAWEIDKPHALVIAKNYDRNIATGLEAKMKLWS